MTSLEPDVTSDDYCDQVNLGDDVEVEPLLLVSEAAFVPPSAVSSAQRRRAWRVCALYFVMHASLSAVTPFTSMYLSKVAPHIDAEGIGFLHALHPISCLLAGPLWGASADHPCMGRIRIERIARVLIITFAVSAATRLAIPFALDSLALLVMVKTVSSIFYGPVKTLCDSLVLEYLGEKDQLDFGKLRMWGQIGCGISSALMINAMTIPNPFGYNLIFVVHAALVIPALICMLSFLAPRKEGNVEKCAAICIRSPIEVEQNWLGLAGGIGSSEKDPLFKDTPNDGRVTIRETVPLLMRDGRITLLFSLVLTKGFAMGFLETFVYVYIRSTYVKRGFPGLGYDLMISRICLSLGAMVSFYSAAALARRFGSSERLLFVSLFCIGCIFFLYSGIDTNESVEVLSPRRANIFLAELLRGLSFAAFNTTAVVRLRGISPPNMRSTMLTVMNEFVYQGIGITCGSWYGGRLISALGMPVAFRHVGKVVVGSLILVLAAAGSKTTMERCSLLFAQKQSI